MGTKKVKVCIKIEKSNTNEFTGRFLGSVNSDEFNWIINNPEIAERKFTAQSVPIHSLIISPGNRVVIATMMFNNVYDKILFLTPVINYTLSDSDKTITVVCNDNARYTIMEM